MILAAESKETDFQLTRSGEGILVGSWLLEVEVVALDFDEPLCVRPKLHVCCGQRPDEITHSAYLSIGAWPAARPMVQKALHREVARAVLSRLRRLLTRLPRAEMLPRLPYSLRLADEREQREPGLNLTQLELELVRQLSQTELLPAVNLEILKIGKSI